MEDNPIEIPDDGERVITVDGDKIYVDGVEKATIESSGFVRDENGVIIGTISRDHDGTNAWWTFTPYPEGGSQFYFHLDDGRVVINWERTQIDMGWCAPVPPPVHLPENMAADGEPAQRNLTPDQKRRVASARARFKAALK